MPYQALAGRLADGSEGLRFEFGWRKSVEIPKSAWKDTGDLDEQAAAINAALDAAGASIDIRAVVRDGALVMADGTPPAEDAPSGRDEVATADAVAAEDAKNAAPAKDDAAEKTP